MSHVRTRPARSVLDVLRARIDPAELDAAVFALEAVVADLGYGDVRPIPGSVAWIDRLREHGTRIGLVFAGDNADAALELAGVGERFDAVESHRPLGSALDALGVAADRAVVVDVDPEGIRAAREAGSRLAIGLARGGATPEALRRAGAEAVVADLQELL